MAALNHPADPLRARALSLAEWSDLPEDDDGELADGLLEAEEMPDLVHEAAVAWVFTALAFWLRGRGGFVLGSEVKLALAEDRGRKPDVSVYLPGRVPPGRGVVRLPPDIAVEVVSPTPRDERRDRVEKFGEYAAFGIRFYWILDPSLGSLEVFELQRDGRYARALAATSGLVSQVPGCEGLKLDLDHLWREIERLGPEEA
jgi:Uma2 family endonuclease